MSGLPDLPTYFISRDPYRSVVTEPLQLPIELSVEVKRWLITSLLTQRLRLKSPGLVEVIVSSFGEDRGGNEVLTKLFQRGVLLSTVPDILNQGKAFDFLHLGASGSLMLSNVNNFPMLSDYWGLLILRFNNRRGGFSTVTDSSNNIIVIPPQEV